MRKQLLTFEMKAHALCMADRAALKRKKVHGESRVAGELPQLLSALNDSKGSGM
ncbi:MAG: hypothetical protein K2X93_22345 [Candidatus Obscuribacterales bacterium]|nr:hypothetical protein [Candidatus Obscuribacterales bacterium]